MQRVKILDMHVALWRDAREGVHCVTDECPQSGARLTDGHTAAASAGGETREMISTSDGTAYDAVTGQLLGTGAEGGDAPRLEVWDCIERGGFVWLFFGDKDMPLAARPPIPWVPELDKKGAEGRRAAWVACCYC